jgi:diguanylate cyclase (GGDEF)-like protein
MATNKLETIDEVIDYIEKFRNSRIKEYRDEIREYSDQGYGPYPAKPIIIRGMHDIFYNVEEVLDTEIPGFFVTHKSLFKVFIYLKNLSKKQMDKVEEILKDYNSKGDIAPSGVYALQKMAIECYEFSDHILTQECVINILGEEINRIKDQKFKILDAPDLLEGDKKIAFGPLGCSILFMDIDKFKLFNTKYTETVVDIFLLSPYQNLIVKLVEKHGFAYAQGGDETAILLPGFSKEMAFAFAENIRKIIEFTEFNIENDNIKLTVSIGVAHANNYASSNDLLNKANKAENEAKKQGRNRVVLSK